MTDLQPVTLPDGRTGKLWAINEGWAHVVLDKLSRSGRWDTHIVVVKLEELQPRPPLFEEE